MKIEEWRQIKGFPHYEVSSFGNIRSWKPKNGRGKKATVSKLLKLSEIQGKDYLRVKLSHYGVSETFKVHRLVLEAFVGDCPEEMEGCHEDGNGKNNNLDNLRWDNHSNNMLDRHAHGTAGLGEKSAVSKLSYKQVLEIKSELSKAKHGISRMLARKFNVSDSAISSIKNNRTWK